MGLFILFIPSRAYNLSRSYICSKSKSNEPQLNRSFCYSVRRKTACTFMQHKYANSLTNSILFKLQEIFLQLCLSGRNLFKVFQLRRLVVSLLIDCLDAKFLKMHSAQLTTILQEEANFISFKTNLGNSMYFVYISSHLAFQRGQGFNLGLITQSMSKTR